MQQDTPVPTYEAPESPEARPTDPVAAKKLQLKYLLVIVALLVVAAVAALVLNSNNNQAEEELQTEEMNEALELEIENSAGFPQEEFVPYEELPIM